MPDAADACPDQAGAPSPLSQKNGCPGLVEVQGAALLLGQPVAFASKKDKLAKKSLPLLQAVADALAASPQLKKVRIEAYAQDSRKPEPERELAERRARSVLQWLVEHGVEPARLEAQGLGPAPPGPAGRAARGVRVDFVIVDPPAAARPASSALESSAKPAEAGPAPKSAAPAEAGQIDKTGQTDKTDKTDKADKADKAAKTDKADKADKPGKRPHHRRRKAP